MVTCDPREHRLSRHLQATPQTVGGGPVGTTAAYDRGCKFERYRNIDTIEEVLLMEQDRRHADLFRRETDGRWVLESHGPTGEIRLASLGLALPLDRVYEDVPAAPT